MATEYALLYPTEEIPLARLSRAALATVGPAYVTVVAGAGSQVLRVPADAADRIREAAGARPHEDVPEEGEGVESQPASGARRPADSSGGEPGRAAGSTGGRTSGRPAGRAGVRAAKKTTAKKSTSARSARSSSKEGDDK
ncbi:hypothetical protein ACFPC0_10970 [Streptomyces andamanensis]|uniref:Uncharacterized protein n=1 Tax=Streptomyces andamanensis TaxID=1565035 RepID=A0ABV8TCM4_9ACTN